MAASSLSFKTVRYTKPSREPRRIVTDGSFFKGVYVTNALLDNQTSKLLVNYNLKDNGSYITPRLGISASDTTHVATINRKLTADAKIPGVHSHYYGLYRDADGLDKFALFDLSFGVPTAPEYRYYMTDTNNLSASYFDQVYKNGGTGFCNVYLDDGSIHPVDVSAMDQTRLKFWNHTPKPLYTVMSNKLHCVNGIDGETITTEEHTLSGRVSLLNTYLDYDGTFESFIINGAYKNGYDSGHFDIDIYNIDGDLKHRIQFGDYLRYLSPNCYDTLDLTRQKWTKNIKRVNINNDLTWKQPEVNPDDPSFKDIALLPIFVTIDGSVKALSIEDVNESLDYISVSNFSPLPIRVDIDKSNPNSSAQFHQQLTEILTDLVKDPSNAGKYIFIRTYDSSKPTEGVSAGAFALLVPVELTEDGVTNLMKITDVTYGVTNPEEATFGVGLPIKSYAGGYLKVVLNANRTMPQINYNLKYSLQKYKRSGGLLQMIVKRDSGGKYTMTPTKIEAKKISISEATSVGFNMLADNPYVFENTSGLALSADGILPYKSASERQIMLSANIGEPIYFVVVYTYKASEKYKAKWEYAPYGSSEYTVLKDYDTEYTNGSEIGLLVKPEHEKFTLRVTITPLNGSDLDQPRSKVATYPVYQVGNTYLKDISSFKYNLHDSNGMGSFNNMLLLWGVNGAETTLFFSDIEDPSYFPFPNNIHVFNDKVLGIQNYKGALLVFTESSIYLMEGTTPLNMTVTPIYQGMSFTKEDMYSVQIIKDMIFVQSGDIFYMLSPNSYTGSISNVKLNIISTPVKELINDFDSFVKFLGTNVFNWDIEFDRDTVIKQYDFFNYIQNNSIRNVYRFAVYKDEEELKRYQIDIILVYNTDTKVWTIETANFPFNEISTFSGSLYTTYAQRLATSTKIFTQELSYRNPRCNDIYNTIYYGDAVNDKITSDYEDEAQKLPATGTYIVKRIIDGDTIEVEGLSRSVRLLYVNTPESTTKIEAFGPEATTYLKNILPLGSDVVIEFEGTRTDKYGRLLAWVFRKLEDRNELVQTLIAQQGYVKSVYNYGVSKYTQEVDEAIKEAVSAGIGIYKYTGEGPQYIYSYNTESLLPNYQILDTGNKKYGEYQHKRYREFQLLMSNKSNMPLKFFTRFYLDSVVRQDFIHPEIQQNVDTDSPDYGTIYIEDVEESNLDSGSITALDIWQLDTSNFDPLDVIKLKFMISGKGYYPRILLISKNEEMYDILGYAWVLRIMSAR